MGNSAKKLRTVEVEPGEFSLIKPGELIDIVEMSPLTLHDRRVYNLLMLNAWESVLEPKEHCIAKRELRGTHHTSERVGDSVLRLMSAIVQVRVVRDDGKSYIRRVQLLSTTDEGTDENGLLYYNFTAGLRAILKNSSQFARLQKDVMFAFSSKYALALYEVVQKRGNLKHKWTEEFSIERFRQLLNVEAGLHREYKNLNLRVIAPAVLEVNGLGEFGCKVEPVYKGRKVIALRLSWWAKTLEQKKAAFRELRISRVGRRARLLGTVETVAPGTVPPPPAELPKPGWSGLKGGQLNSMRDKFPGIDIDEMERQFIEWVKPRGEPDNYASALYGFITKKLARDKAEREKELERVADLSAQDTNVTRRAK
jgi:Initiator Replication protein